MPSCDAPTSEELRRWMRELYVRGDLETLEQTYREYRASLDRAPWRGIVRRELEFAIERLKNSRRPMWIRFWKRALRKVRPLFIKE